MLTSVSSAEMLNARQYGPPVLTELPRALPRARAGLDDDDDDGNAAFVSRRRSLALSGSRNPIERVAAFLVAISQNNRYEGRDPHTIPDSLTSGFVANLLGVDVPVLADLLIALERKGLVAANRSAGLTLTNFPGLEKLADAH
jgi:Crp-like helix-turn-helix protein